VGHAARGVLVLPVRIRRAILAHARSAAPRECCGLLLGRGLTISAICRTANVASGKPRYQIDPQAHLDLRRVLRGVWPPLEILGAYHSHPRGPAVPSATDIVESPGAFWLHVIVGLEGRRPAFGAFRIVGARVRRVPLTAQLPETAGR
jgi:proteasome lid subunit RPN8/RPN11